MKRWICLLSLGLLGCGSSVELLPGDPAPPFALEGSDGEQHTLAEHLGERAVVVAWFPRAFTGG